jgi:hypothetical protein
LSSEEILSLPDPQFKARIVQLILSKQTETAVELVSKRYKVRTPRLGVGPTKGKKIALAVYSVQANSILFSDQEHYFDPFVILHEMYHCIRSASGSHRGTEKNADRFALDYIAAFKMQFAGAFDLQISKVD